MSLLWSMYHYQAVRFLSSNLPMSHLCLWNIGANYIPVTLCWFLFKTLDGALFGQPSCLQLIELLDASQSIYKAMILKQPFFQSLPSSWTSLMPLTLWITRALGATLWRFLSQLQDQLYHISSRFSISSPHSLTAGVPQGSVLGPNLLTLYTKSFLAQISQKISDYLSDISPWRKIHYQKLNLGKTELIYLLKYSTLWDIDPDWHPYRTD